MLSSPTKKAAEKEHKDIVWKGVSAPLSFFIPSCWYPLLFRNMQPPTTLTPWHQTTWHHPSQENNKFYDDTQESGRLKTINIKS